jgi:hypothetical protein
MSPEEENLMKSGPRKTAVAVLALALLVVGGASASADMAKGSLMRISERAEGNQLIFEVGSPFEVAELEIKGPRGARIQESFAAGEPITVTLGVADAPDGLYRYTLRVSPAPTKGRGLKRGVLFVRDGSFQSRGAKRAELNGVRNRLNQERRETFQQARAGREKAPPAARGGGDPTISYPYYSIDIYDSYPTVAFYHYNTGTYGYDFTGMVYGASFSGYSLYSYGYTWNNMYAGYYNGGGNWLVGPSNYTWGTVYGNYDYAYGLNYHYGYAISNYAAYGNIWNVAYGYAYNGAPYYGGNVILMGTNYDGGYGAYYDSFLAATPLGVGVQTAYPTADLEVYDYGSYAAMRLNNGTATWAFSNTPVGVFTVNKIGSGGQEFSVRDRFDAAGNTMQVQGSVQGTKFVASSSRDLKTDFTAIDGQEVLAKLAEIPVMSWRYKTDDEADRHFGPVAEDFQAAFQLGDGKTIANIDADGVALAAIKGLDEIVKKELNRKDEEIALLRRNLAALERRLAALESGGR